MRDSVYRFTLDIHELASQVQIKAKKNDIARKIYITLMEEGKPYNIDAGCFAVFMMKKPDGTIIMNDCYLINSGSIIAYDFTEQTTTSEGMCECEIRLYGRENDIITSPRFTMLVSDNVYEDGQVESTDEFTSLKEAYVGANNMDIDAEDGTITITRKDASKKVVFENTGEYIDIPTGDDIADIRNSIIEIVDVQHGVQDDLTDIHSRIDTMGVDIDAANGEISSINDALNSVNDNILNINDTIDGIGYNIEYINETFRDKQDKLIAGTNIIISSDGRTISSTGGGGSGSSVSMQDVESGGVKLIVDGEYNILAKESEIPSAEDKARWDGKMDQVELASVSTSGSYSDLENKPSINGVYLEGSMTSSDLNLEIGTNIIPISRADYETLSEEEKNRNVIYAVESDTQLDADNVAYGDGSVKDALDEVNQNLNNIGTISTEEQVIGKWIDGKPLYRKTVLFTSGSGFGEWALTDYISDYENVFLDTNFTLGYIEKDGVVSDCFYGTWGSEQRFSYVVVGNTTSKKFQVQRERTMKICATFLYTKTTD